jgi:hypothetical protein
LEAVYDIVAEPEESPVTVPVDDTVAMPVDELTQLPPLPLVVSEIEAATHTDAGPLIVPATGNGLTVTGCVATSVPQPLVTE